MSERPFRDAEAWLAEQGVRRDPLRVPLQPPAAPLDDEQVDPAGAPTTGGVDAGPPVGAREAARLAANSADETARRADEAMAAPATTPGPRLEDEVADAVAFVQRSTANTPQAEGRVIAKLRERGWDQAVITQAMERCRRTGMVDDGAMAAALVEEGRRKGHAPRRLRADLRRRGIADEIIEQVLARTEHEDPEAAAFAVARAKADSLTGVDGETAFRRIVGHLARRGHPEALARKVARAAVFDARDAQRTAER